MKKLIFLFLIFFAILINTSAQIISINWENNYGGTGYESATEALEMADNGYIFTGGTESNDYDVSFNIGTSDFWVTKIDFTGNILWEQTYGGTGFECSKSICLSFGGGFVIAGYTYSSDGDITDNAGIADCWIIKIDSMGNLEWQTTIGGSQTDFANSVIQTPDSGFIATGLSRSDDGDIAGHFGSFETQDLIVFKLDKFGNLVWSKVYGGGGDDYGNCITNTSDGNYLICGTTNLYGYFDYWVLKIDPDGNLIWDKSYGGTEYELAYSILETANKNILITGEAYSHNGDVDFHHPGANQDMWTVLLDSEGEIIWNKSLGGNSADVGYGLVECSDGSFTIAGITTTLNNGDVSGHHGGTFISDIWIVKLDSNGVIKWQKCLGSNNGESIGSINKIDDTKFIAFGESYGDDGDVSGHYYGDTPAPDVWVVEIEETCDQFRYFADADGDTFGDDDNYIYSCNDTIGYVLIQGDCDDDNPNIYPGATEILNGLDDDCNQLIDDDVALIENINAGFKIYPNPIQNTLFITNNTNAIATFSITTFTGQLLYSADCSANTQIDMQCFSSGVYLFSIYTENGVVARVVMKE